MGYLDIGQFITESQRVTGFAVLIKMDRQHVIAGRPSGRKLTGSWWKRITHLGVVTGSAFQPHEIVIVSFFIRLFAAVALPSILVRNVLEGPPAGIGLRMFHSRCQVDLVVELEFSGILGGFQRHPSLIRPKVKLRMERKPGDFLGKMGATGIDMILQILVAIQALAVGRLTDGGITPIVLGMAGCTP